MYKEISKLIMYGNLDNNSILSSMADIFNRFDNNLSSKEELITDIYTQIKRILEVATDYGFDNNLWHNYLTYFLITNENPFSITCEKVGANDGSVNIFARNDFKVFYNLFHYDFSEIEEKLGIDCFSIISNYKAIVKKELMYNKNVSEKVRELSSRLERTKNENEFFDEVTEFYKAFGVGMFGLNKAFRISSDEKDGLVFHPINNMDKVVLDDLIGYEIQKQKLVENTENFVQGLRMIEIYKHQFKDLSNVIASIKNRNYKFIIYMDDLSFEEFEIEYKFLKAVIEGGVETKPDNILIYATSNRRHLIKETWNDRNDMETTNGLHRSDTIEEKMSLVNRFGCQICYSKPSNKEYYDIVIGLARKSGLDMTDEELMAEANKWELSHGGISGRTAQQFINHCLGMQRSDS